MPEPVWLTDLKKLLCQLYQAWGGDCSDLGMDPPSQITTVIDEYALDGAPTFPDAPAQAAFYLTLDELEAHLALPTNTLSTYDTTRLTNLIADLRPAIN